MGVTEQTGQPWIKSGHDDVDTETVYLAPL
jgi:hypothetical protein